MGKPEALEYIMEAIKARSPHLAGKALPQWPSSVTENITISCGLRLDIRLSRDKLQSDHLKFVIEWLLSHSIQHFVPQPWTVLSCHLDVVMSLREHSGAVKEQTRLVDVLTGNCKYFGVWVSHDVYLWHCQVVYIHTMPCLNSGHT